MGMQQGWRSGAHNPLPLIFDEWDDGVKRDLLDARSKTARK